ncbi:hypothetical protein GCM10011387_23070 [Pedobacter quisquiliarum]|uniref:Uncharacterized protein n=1 Tax=Pedobacter quisquiliarum TaxID=1834438 RepID=A0A916UE66_9SPHI|nr:hypothetical protein GCM10011387_23070 [Pedobacter quisquiliarum]
MLVKEHQANLAKVKEVLVKAPQDLEKELQALAKVAVVLRTALKTVKNLQAILHQPNREHQQLHREHPLLRLERL